MHTKTCRSAGSNGFHKPGEPITVYNAICVKENEDVVPGSLDALGNGDIFRLGTARQYPEAAVSRNGKQGGFKGPIWTAGQDKGFPTGILDPFERFDTALERPFLFPGGDEDRYRWLLARNLQI